jgi:Domain of unknown function (DUF4091)
MTWQRWLAVAIIAAVVVVAAWLDHPGPTRVTVLGSLVSVRLDRPTPTGESEREARLLAARNEFESFQIAVDAGSSLHGLRVTSSGPLRGPGGASISAHRLTIYREAAYRVKVPSDSEGAGGLWPDALIPKRDYLYGERRDAFPVDVPAGGKAVAWIDVFVPPRQPAGTYRGAVRVSDASGALARIPIRLRVIAFSLPSTSSLPSAFSTGSGRLCMAQTGARCPPDSPLGWRLGYLYARAGLENRITIPNPQPMAGPPHGRKELALFRRFELPLIQGRSLPGLRPPRLQGARLTSLEAYGGDAPDDGAKPRFGCATATSACLSRWRSLANTFGFAGRFFLFLCDEPDVAPPSRWPYCRASAARVRRSSWPHVRTLVTTSIQQVDAHRAASYIDTLTPNPQELADKPGNPLAGDQRGRYDTFLRRPGRRLWLYTSCISYGCGPGFTFDPYATGWPAYAIDQPASQARAMGWLEFLYHARGELYYAVDRSLGEAWQSQLISGGNGDGNLFYPGVPRGTPVDKRPDDYFPVGGTPAIGGVHPIPIESIRLKRIRDGREDYEYLRALAERGEGARARRVVARLLSDGNPRSTALDAATFSTTFSQAALDGARCELARTLDPTVERCPL